jgi:alpha-galactosidase
MFYLIILTLFSHHVSANRGINSWDSYLEGMNETIFLTQAAYVRDNLAQYGYIFNVIDAGWQNDENGNVLIDGNGLPVVDVKKYPSSAGGKGFGPLADQIHQMGLKIGLWLIRGIPKAGADQKLPILNSNLTLDLAATNSTPCAWDKANYGSTYPSQAAIDYYTSLAQRFADWKIDFLKVDCMWPNLPYNQSRPQLFFDEDLIGMGTAFKEKEFVVSLSPGISLNPSNGSFVDRNKLASAYRVSEDLWDVYDSNSTSYFPSTVKEKLKKAQWYAQNIALSSYARPDFDMLPLGYMYHDGGASGPGPTLLSHDEQYTVMTLWCITGAQLIFGGRLPLEANDTFTLPLITNAEVLRSQNESNYRWPVVPITDPTNEIHNAWAAQDAYRNCSGIFCMWVALFNTNPTVEVVSISLADVFVPAGFSVCVTELWSNTKLDQVTDVLSATVNGHGALMFYLTSPLDGPC